MDIEIILRNNGKSITEERKIIFGYLETKHIFSAQEILEQFPTLGRASIFRTLRLFVDIGVIRRLNIGERGESYELNHVDHHHEHMKCESCHTILSFESRSICHKIFQEAKKQGFKIQEHSLSILGKCSKCQSI